MEQELWSLSSLLEPLLEAVAVAFLVFDLNRTVAASSTVAAEVYCT